MEGSSSFIDVGGLIGTGAGAKRKRSAPARHDDFEASADAESDRERKPREPRKAAAKDAEWSEKLVVTN